jgi:hypothetical protein
MLSQSQTPSAKSIVDPVLIDFRENLLTISSKAALPPGSRVEFDLPVKSGAAAVPIKGKVISIAPLSSDAYRLVIRLHSLTREQRATLEL